VAAAILVLVVDDAPHEVRAEWIDFRSVPADVRTGEQPAQSEGGVQHEIHRCALGSGDLEAVVDFDNPYERPLRSILALSVDDESEGLVWGWFQVRLPPGEARAVVESRGAPARPRRNLRSTLERIESPVGCSAHLLGFEEGPRFTVRYPVASRPFDG
jgi:hypothetical protein